MRRFGAFCAVLLGGFACADPASIERPPACDAECDGASTCELSADPECRFHDPGPWFVVESMIDSEVAPLGGRGELYAFPSSLGHVVTPLPIGQDSLDDEFWVSWSQQWSPDGELLVYDSCNGYDELTLECRLFSIEFGDGLPGSPRRIENLPHGTPMYAHDWSADSSAFIATNDEEVYLVRREENELVPSFLMSGEVGYMTVCPGGEYALHDDRDGTVTLIHLGGDTDRNVTLGTDYSSARLSPDHRFIATTSADTEGDEPRYWVSLRPCGEGEDIRLFETAQGDVYGWFSPDSRYLIVDELFGETVGYVDLRDEALPLLSFPEDVVWTSSWSASASYLVVGASDGSAFAFRPESGELLPIGEPGRVVASADTADIWALGEIVEYYARDPESGELTRVELYDPLLSSEPIVTFEPEPGTFDSMVIDRDSTHVAYKLEHALGAALTIVDLSEPEARSSLLLPGAFSLWLEHFSYDGRAVVLTLSQPEFGQYWISVPPAGEPPVLRVILPSQGGAYVGEQPWP